MNFDTSVLVACYTDEARSDEAVALLEHAATRYVSDLAVTEFGVTIARKVREGYLTSAAGTAVVSRFDADMVTIFQRLPIDHSDFLAARDLALSSKVPLRTLDALHAAVCRNHAIGLATFDARLGTAARESGLRVVP